MNFTAFQPWREQCLQKTPDALDCAETNLYHSLASLQPKPDALNTGQLVHRCDLARAWLSRYGLWESDTRRALVCRGVRHALSLIFKEMAENGAVLWAPSDVYHHKTIVDKAGNEICVEITSEYHSTAQILAFTLFYLHGGKLVKTKKVNMRCFYPEELLALCHFNGLKVVRRCGDYDGASFMDDSPKQILFCRKPPK